MGPTGITERALDDQRLRCIDHVTFAAMLPEGRNQTEVVTIRWEVSCFGKPWYAISKHKYHMEAYA